MDVRGCSHDPDTFSNVPDWLFLEYMVESKVGFFTKVLQRMWRSKMAVILSSNSDESRPSPQALLRYTESASSDALPRPMYAVTLRTYSTADLHTLR